MVLTPERAPARAAATVVLLRPGPGGPEVLLTRRPSTMRFGADLHVFPGGRIEAGEDAVSAAVRETLEETGIELDPSSLRPVGRWVTPFNLPIRFDARFFAGFVDRGIDLVAASDEVVDARWLRPTAALEAMRAGELAMWQPTVVTLQHLEMVEHEDDLADIAGSGAEVPASVPVPGARTFGTTWAGGIEGRPGITTVLGDRAWLVVDPADPTGETTDRILAAARDAGATLAGVLVTGLEPERHAGVEMFATGLGLPVAGPPGAAHRVPYGVLELASGAIPFGDSGLGVESVVGEVSGTARPRDAGIRWADRAGRLRLRAAPAGQPAAGQPAAGG